MPYRSTMIDRVSKVAVSDGDGDGDGGSPQRERTDEGRSEVTLDSTMARKRCWLAHHMYTASTSRASGMPMAGKEERNGRLVADGTKRAMVGVSVSCLAVAVVNIATTSTVLWYGKGRP